MYKGDVAPCEKALTNLNETFKLKWILHHIISFFNAKYAIHIQRCFLATRIY